MASVNWELGLPRVNIMAAADEGFAAGRALRRERDTDDALRALSANPNDRGAALNALMLDPKRAGVILDYDQQMRRRDAISALMSPSLPQTRTQADNMVGTPPAANNWQQSTEGQPGVPPSQQHPLALNGQALRQLFTLDPDLAMKLRRMDADQREEARQAITDNYEMTSRIVAAIRQVPEQDRPAAYQELRGELAGSGFDGLPETWDEQRADSLMHLGLTAAQVFDNARSDRRLDADLANIEADNARADRSAASLDRYRQGQLGSAKRGQDIASRDRIRGQDQASVDRRRGQDLAASRGPRGGPPQLPNSAGKPAAATPARGAASAPVYATNPQTGERLQLVNGQWVSAR